MCSTHFFCSECEVSFVCTGAKKTICYTLLLLLIGSGVYVNTVSAPFIYDDCSSITNNPHIRQLWPPEWLFSSPQNSPVQGRPVVSFTMALNYAIGGFDVLGYHIVNIAIHIFCALTLFWDRTPHFALRQSK